MSSIANIINKVKVVVTNIIAKALKIPDYSKELNNIMVVNAVEAKLVSDALGGLNTIEYFYNHVNKGVAWDYKLEERWTASIDYLTPNQKYQEYLFATA